MENQLFCIIKGKYGSFYIFYPREVKNLFNGANNLYLKRLNDQSVIDESVKRILSSGCILLVSTEALNGMNPVYSNGQYNYYETSLRELSQKF
ncbi:MAG: hypothetical protein KQA41_03720 [Candidatus Aenigmarchaeota archaeon]|nr:hypothetical protein [Candidatus Aenigmarchaeota archaeon]